MSYFTHQFEGVIENHNVGTYRYTVIFLPSELALRMRCKDNPRMRVSGEIGEVPFVAAWQPVRGRWYMMLSKRTLRAAQMGVGDRVDVRFRIESPDHVLLPEPLEKLLEASARLKNKWMRLSPGSRRRLAYRVSSAVHPTTIERRLEEVRAELNEGEASNPHRHPRKKAAPRQGKRGGKSKRSGKKEKS